MNKLISFLIFYFFLTNALAQDNLAIGLYGGTAQYMGDMNKMNPFFSPAPSYGFGIISDHNLRYSFQLMGSYNTLRAGTKYADQYVLPEPYESFSRKQWDLSITAEFNFLPYESYNSRKRNFTPFIYAGLGTNFAMDQSANNFPVTIPFGLGLKYNIFERISIGIQWKAHKIFYDDMDNNVVNVWDPENRPRIHNDDWYHHAFFFLIFKPFEKIIDCPTYEE